MPQKKIDCPGSPHGKQWRHLLLMHHPGFQPIWAYHKLKGYTISGSTHEMTSRWLLEQHTPHSSLKTTVIKRTWALYHYFMLPKISITQAASTGSNGGASHSHTIHAMVGLKWPSGVSFDNEPIIIFIITNHSCQLACMKWILHQFQQKLHVCMQRSQTRRNGCP